MPPAPSVSPAKPRPAEAAAMGGVDCPNHPGVVAVRLCTRCGLSTCQACAVVKQYGRVQVETCGKCGGVLRVVDPAVHAAARGDERAARALRGPAFYLRPADYLRFPFTGLAGIVVMVFFALLQAVLMSLGKFAIFRRGLATVLFYGLLLSIASYIIRRVSLGEDRIAAPEEFAGVWEDVYAPCSRFLLVLSPFIAAFIVAAYESDEPDLLRAFFTQPIPIALFGVGLLFLPGGTLQAASEGRWRLILNPLSHLRVLLVAPRESFAAVGYTILLLGAYGFLRLPLHRAGFVAELVDGLLNAYVALVLARMFGLYYRDLESIRDLREAA
jgi:hypothetical protein